MTILDQSIGGEFDARIFYVLAGIRNAKTYKYFIITWSNLMCLLHFTGISGSPLMIKLDI